MKHALTVVAAATLAVAFSAGPCVRAEIIEEIVAKVNDDIITRSEIDREEKALTAELYRRFTGDELDRTVQEAKSRLLQDMIDRKLLIHRAERLYDVDKMQEVLLENFMDQQGIKDRKELERLLAQDGMNVDDLTRRLVEMAAPGEVIRFEVGNRLAVSDSELETYYRDHAGEFAVKAEVTLREIVLLASEAEKADRRAEAERVHERVTSGEEDFAQVAHELSDSASAPEGGLVGPFRRGDLMKVIDEVAFSIPVGTVSDILESENGFHVVKVESRTEDGSIPLDDVRDELRTRLEDEKYAAELEKFLIKARDEATICVDPKYRGRFVLDVDSNC